MNEISMNEISMNEISMNEISMNPQQIYDKVLVHLRNQGVRAVDARTRQCRYRGKDGTTCAIGCLITDDAYDPGIEGIVVQARLRENRAVVRTVLTRLGLDQHLPLLCSLQRAHDLDLGRGMDNFERRMQEIAQDHHLVYTPPSTEVA